MDCTSIYKAMIFGFLLAVSMKRVKLLDPESALVSKAVKDPTKNKVLIIDAIASGKFLNLVERIEANGGNLEYFLGDDHEEE